MCSVIFCLIFSSSLHLTVLIIRLFLFFVMINSRQSGVGTDRTDEVGDRNSRGTRWGGGATGTCHVIFVIYSLNFFFSPFFFSNCLQYDNRCGGMRNGTDAGSATWDGTGGQTG